MRNAEIGCGFKFDEYSLKNLKSICFFYSMQLLIQPRSTHHIATQILSILQRFGGASCQTSAPWPWQWVLEHPKVSTISCKDYESLTYTAVLYA